MCGYVSVRGPDAGASTVKLSVCRVQGGWWRVCVDGSAFGRGDVENEGLFGWLRLTLFRTSC